MKKLHILLLSTVFMFLSASSAHAVVNYFPDLGENDGLLQVAKKMEINSVEDFLELTPKKIKEATGEKLKLKEVIALKAAQKKIKKIQKENKPIGKGAYIVLAIIGWGFLGIGLNTDWEGNDWLICLLLGLTCIGGLIYALVKMGDYY